MLKCRLVVVIACLVVASPGARAGARFALLSRSLVEGPARSVSFFDRGLILGTGSGVAVWSGDEALGNPAYLPLDGKPYDICVKDTVAYVAVFGSGLAAIDLSDPRTPTQVYSYRAPRAMHCAVGGNRLYLADQNQLFVFDITSPRAPVLKTRMIAWPNHAMIALGADRDLLCLATDRACTVYRVHHGATLERVAETHPEPGIRRADLTSGVLCILTSGGRLQWRDLDAPGRPLGAELSGPKALIDFGLTESGGILLTRDLDIVPFTIERQGSPDGERTAASLALGRRIAQRNLKSRALAGETENAPVLAAHRSFSPACPGSRFAIVWPLGGMSLFALERNGARHIGRFETSGFALNVIASNGILYVANGADGVRIGEVRESGAVDWVSRIPMEEARDIALAGKSLVIANGKYGLAIADVSDPRSPRIIATSSPNKLLGTIRDGFGGRRVKSDYYLSAVVTRGTKAYCAGGIEGVEIFDISNERRPNVVWRDELSPNQFEEVRGIDVDDRNVYVSNGYQGFRIFSLDEGRPAPIASLKTGGWTCGCAIVGNTLFLANGGSGVAAADVSDRKQPKLLGSISIGSIAREVFALGSTLFVAGERAGVVAVDVSDPRNLSIRARFKGADDARGVFADERFVYLADGEGGVCVFRLDE